MYFNKTGKADKRINSSGIFLAIFHALLIFYCHNEHTLSFSLRLQYEKAVNTVSLHIRNENDITENYY